MVSTTVSTNIKIVCVKNITSKKGLREHVRVKGIRDEKQLGKEQIVLVYYEKH